MYQSTIYAFLRIGTLFFDLVKKHLSPAKENRILEIGCSRGKLLQKIQDIAPDSYGVDVNQKAIDAGVTSNLQVMDATKLEFPDGFFDKIYTAHTVEHIPDLLKALQEMARVLKRGGRALLIYPAEPIRGLFCIPSAFILRKNPLAIHVHKLSPERLIKEFISQTQFRHIESRFSFFPIPPQYITVLEKI